MARGYKRNKEIEGYDFGTRENFLYWGNEQKINLVLAASLSKKSIDEYLLWMYDYKLLVGDAAKHVEKTMEEKRRIINET